MAAQPNPAQQPQAKPKRKGQSSLHPPGRVRTQDVPLNHEPEADLWLVMVAGKGTRSVSALTQAQLDRKRANDRQAQRAIRERTKSQIAKLEKRVAELQSAEYRDATIRGLREKNEALETEIQRLKSELDQARMGQSMLASYARQRKYHPTGGPKSDESENESWGETEVSRALSRRE